MSTLDDPLGDRLTDDEFRAAQAERNAAAPGCLHPPQERRLIEGGDQLCGICYEVLPRPEVSTGDPSGATTGTGDPAGQGMTAPRGATVSREEGAADPASGQGWLAHVDPSNYTPAQVELEILNLAGRLNSGARFEAARLKEAAELKLEYELAYARAYVDAVGTVDYRKQVALLRCEDLYTRWQTAEVVARTAREGMHTLRSQLSGLQTVSRSVTAAATGR